MWSNPRHSHCQLSLHGHPSFVSCPSWTHSHPLLSPNRSFSNRFLPASALLSLSRYKRTRSTFPRSTFSLASTELKLFLLRTPVWIIRKVTEISTSLAYHLPTHLPTR